MDTRTLLDAFRAWPWLVFALVAAAFVGWHAPGNIGVLVWSLTKLTLAAYLGYWIDRSLFPFARPKQREHEESADRARLRRAVVVAATMLALGLGV